MDRNALEKDQKQGAAGVKGDVCVVCGDRASGRYYKAMICKACRSFYKLSMRKYRKQPGAYFCIAGAKQCEVTKHLRSRCQYCRLQKCLQMGMRSSRRQPLNNQRKGGNTDAALGSLPSYPGAEESESAGESGSIERKAIETISNVINEGRGEGNYSPHFSGIDTEAIIPEGCSQFVLVGPGSVPKDGLVNIEYICETASRLLFLSIHTARSLPAFKALPSEIQLAIMKSAWTDLFAVGLVQWQNIIPLPSVVSALTNCTSSKLTSVAEHISKLQVFIKLTQNLHLDEFGFAALKALALFSSDRYVQFGTSMCMKMHEMQLSVLKQLQEHIIRLDREDGKEYLSEMLLLLPSLRSLNSTVVEEVFFSSVLGATQIESIIPYMLKMESDPSSTNCDSNN